MADDLSITAVPSGAKLRATEVGGVFTPHHLEDVDQRAALLAKLEAMITALGANGSLAKASQIGNGAEPDAESLCGRIKTVADKLTTMTGYVDGLEALISTLNGYADGIEGLLGTSNTTLASIAGFVDGLEALSGTTNASLTALAGYVDGLEALTATLNTYVDGLETATATIGTRAYNFDAGVTLTAGASNAATAAITATEVLVHCRGGAAVIKTGVAPVATIDGKSIPIEDGEKFHLRITSGHKIAALRLDATDATIFITPVG